MHWFTAKKLVYVQKAEVSRKLMAFSVLLFSPRENNARPCTDEKGTFFNITQGVL